MRAPIITANWKMHHTLQEGIALAQGLIQEIKGSNKENATIILCPAFIHLETIHRLITSLQPNSLYLGAQNCHHEEAGPFTGEVSAAMLRSVGVDYVMIGHSERRQYFKETPALLAAKLSNVLMHNMRPIFCCGEDRLVREQGQHLAWVTEQLTNSLWHLSPTQIAQVLIAYEPVWAIGTGHIPSLLEIEEMHQTIKMQLTQQYGTHVAASVPILYGGSCNAQNAALFLSNPSINGLLVGGASLQIDTFLPIIQALCN